MSQNSDQNSTEVCEFCESSKVKHHCGECIISLCKKCSVENPVQDFNFMREVPAFMHERYFCNACFTEKVEAFAADYEDTVARAEEIYFIPNTFRGGVPVLRKAVRALEPISDLDKDVLIQKLAFETAKLGYNAIIHGDIERKKVRNFAYGKSLYTGTGIPAFVDVDKMKHDELLEAVYGRF